MAQLMPLIGAHTAERVLRDADAYLQNRLRSAGFILRSKAPELVCQRSTPSSPSTRHCALQTRTAEPGGTDPDRISFTVTVQVTRLAVAAQAAADPTTLDAARREVTTELLAARRPVVQPMSGSNPVLVRVG